MGHQLGGCDEAVGRLETIGKLTASIVHDFNNILATIALSSERILELAGTEKGVIYREAERIAQACARGACLTRQVLGFYRNKTIDSDFCNVNEEVAAIRELLPRLMGEAIAIDYELQPQMPDVGVGPSALGQVLMNLLVNARDAMPTGGHLEIRTELRDENVCLTVADSGVGMSSELQSQIFEPFFTTKSGEKGTGLGLAIVRRIVARGEGRIEVESQLGHGTRFRILLPTVKDTGDCAVGASEPAQGENAAITATILVVEDDEGLSQSLTEALKRMGHRVRTARCGLEALGLLRDTSTSFDLVITDVVLPDLKPGEISKEVLLLKPTMKILFCSGYPAKDLERFGFDTAKSAWISKPFSGEVLRQKILEVLKKQSSG